MSRTYAREDTLALGPHGLAELLATHRRSAQVAQRYRQACCRVVVQLIGAVVLCLLSGDSQAVDCGAYLCQDAKGPGRYSSEAWRLRSSGGKMGSCGGFSGFKSAKACLSALLLMTCPSAQSHGLPVLGHTCKEHIPPGC